MGNHGLSSDIVYLPPRRSWARWWAALGFLVCMAATSKITFDVMRWRDAGHIARKLAADRSAPARDRLEAMVVMQRQGCAIKVLLREIETEGGELARDARNCLLAIDGAGR